MQTVAVLTFPDVVAFDLAIPCHIFGLAGYEVRVCGQDVAAAGAFDVVPRYPLAAALDADLVLVPGTDPENTPDPAVVATVAAARGRIASICTGAFVLGAAGCLDDRRCTTHWAYADALAGAYPAARVEPNALYVDEGDLLTSAGVAAGIDLCLHIVRRDRGAKVANVVARRIVVAPHRDGGQAQFIEQPVLEHPLSGTRAWMLGRLAEPLSIDGMAARAGYSPRTFARRFRAETGTTPLAWLLSQRIAAARHLLEETDLAVESIATECGFGTAAGLREHFRRACATTPTAYRAAFRGRAAA